MNFYKNPYPYDILNRGGSMSGQASSTISRSDSIRTRLILAFVSVVLLPMIVISAMLAISTSEGAQKHLTAQLAAQQAQPESGQTTRVLLAVNGSVALGAIVIAIFASLSVTHSIAMPLADLSETAPDRVRRSGSGRGCKAEDRRAGPNSTS
jgi:hypothetical protein